MKVRKISSTAETQKALVSVIVLNYNHKDTIIATLDSIKVQTYNNIELIITDDNSTDDSMNLVESWVERNKKYFKDVKIIYSEKNTGVSGNCNRGVRISKGHYVKLIAADDMLCDFYLEKMMIGIKDNDLAFCYVCMFTNENDLKLAPEELDHAPTSLDTYTLSPRQLYKKQLMRNDFNAPAALIKRTVFDEVCYFDENYPMMEDLPFWLSCVKAKKKIVFVEIYGVLYRRSPKSISLGVSPYANGEQSSTQARFKSDFDRFMKVRRRKMIKNLMFRQMYFSFGEQFFKRITTKYQKHEKIKKIISKYLVVFAPFAMLSRRSNRIDRRIEQKRKKEERSYRLKLSLLDLEKQYKDDLFAAKRSLMFRLRAFPLTKNDKLRIKKIKKDYISKKKNILHKHARRKNKVISYLYTWHQIVLRFVEKMSLKGIPIFFRYVVLVLSPIAIFEKLNKARNVNCKTDCDTEAINTKLRFRFKNEPSYKDDELSKKDWESVFNREILLQYEYQNKKKIGKKIKILFIVHLKMCFSSYESIYLAMKKAKKISASFLIVPKKQPGMNPFFEYDEGLIEYIDGSGYDYEIGYENHSWKSIFDFNPDGIFYQTPYNFQIPAVYSYDLRFAFPNIFYTPYGPWVMDKSVKKFIEAGIEPELFDNCYKVFMDKFSLEMLEHAAPKYSQKCVISGSPKVDFYKSNFIKDTYCWRNKESNNRKKVIWMPRWGLAEGRSSFPDYYKYFENLVNEKKIEFVMRPHPFLWGDLIATKYFSQKEHKKMVESFTSPFNSNIDYGIDYREGLLSCDFLVMDFSSIVYEFLPTGKPIIYTKKDNTLLDSRISDACYIVSNQNELEATVDMLLLGDDPLKQKRQNIIKDLEFFPHNNKTNGSFITDFIIKEYESGMK